MNEKIILKNGKEYPLVTGGTSSTPSTLRLVFQIVEPLEDIITVFSDSAATGQIRVVNGDGDSLSVYDGYTVLDDPKSLDEHYLVTPAAHDDTGAETTPAVYERVAILTLSKPGLRALREHDRADIDYLAVMTGTSL